MKGEIEVIREQKPVVMEGGENLYFPSASDQNTRMSIFTEKGYNFK